MVQQLKVPASGESIQEVQIGQWLKQEGDWVALDEPVVELETDKASLEVPAPAAGVLEKILKQEGEEAQVGEVIALINEQAEVKSAAASEPAPGPLPEPLVIMPAAQRLLAEHGIQGREVPATGPGGRLLKEDVLRYLEQRQQEGAGQAAAPPTAAEMPAESPAGSAPASPESGRSATTTYHTGAQALATISEPQESAQRRERVVPMSLIRRRIAEHLVEAQRQAALLTTFNEVDMFELMRLRKRYQDEFREKYGIKLGIMSFFTKATVAALAEFPALNAEVRGREIVYREFCDMGIAIGSGKGLVVPVLRNAEQMSFADIEQQIADFAQRARDNKLRPEELAGGTFTITNGGVFGSLLSTPIVNAPQSGVLGLHTIQDRPVARDGQVVVRPMMYIALTYDHRIVDGREAVTFLRRIREMMEDPARLLIGI
jgi:2-oxoglutarate dehydrogenase E2 component (dihydrolipoamide succinyltransferase)